ncbi:MAG TPA: class F sortase [Candidatus Paceibacterota bacterium]
MIRILKTTIAIMFLILCAVVLASPRAVPLNSAEELPLYPPIKIEAPTPSAPVQLSIDKIGIYTTIESVGISIGGSMAVPENVNNVGWYNKGAVPGEPGTAVLAGHVNSRGGGDAVFTRLHELEIGDKIRVTNDQGRVETFVVRNTLRYSVLADTSDIFTSTDGLSHLNLITCEGVWSSLFKTHNRRLVIFTDKIEE